MEEGIPEGVWVLAHAALEHVIFCSHDTESMSIFWTNYCFLFKYQDMKCHYVITFGMGSWKLISRSACSQASSPGEWTMFPTDGLQVFGFGLMSKEPFCALHPALLPWRQPHSAAPGLQSQKAGRAASLQVWGTPHKGEGEAELAGEGAPQHHLKASQLSSITIPIKQQSLLVSIFGLKS